VPPLCARCGAPTAWPVERCRECAGRQLAFASARAAFTYAGPARPLLRTWKEGGLRPLAQAAAELVVERLSPPEADVVTYIPPDNDRSIRRGHHPAQGLAAALGRSWGLPVEPLVVRTRRIGRQTGLAHAERRRNVRGAFGVAGALRGRIVLVDDVYTTGATVGAAVAAPARRASTLSRSREPPAEAVFAAGNRRRVAGLEQVPGSAVGASQHSVTFRIPVRHR
jgi:predicted amidophosphoribosyltransferase